MTTTFATFAKALTPFFDVLARLVLFLFIFSIPLQKRVLLSSPGQEWFQGYIEYGSAHFYVSDGIFIMLVFVYLVKFLLNSRLQHSFDIWSKPCCNRYLKFLFVYLKFIAQTLFHVKQFDVFLFAFVVVATLSLLFTHSSLLDIVFNSYFRLFFFVIVFYFLRAIVSRETIALILYSVVFTGVFQAFLAILQFIVQHSVGFSVIGEIHEISVSAPYIAKFFYNGSVVVRSYGTFPHPNVLGGFFVFSIVISIIFHSYLIDRKQLFHMKQLLAPIAIAIQCIGLITTFSRSAWVAITFFVVFTLVAQLFFRLFHVKHFQRLFLPLAIMLILLAPLFLQLIQARLIDHSPAIVSRETMTYSQRSFYNDIAIQSITDHPYIGSGLGTFPYILNNYLYLPAPIWALQPVHNVPLLLAAEIGILGTFVLFLFVCSMIRFSLQSIVSRETMLCIILLTLLFVICLFDHYFVTIQQGRYILWITLVFLVTFPQVFHRHDNTMADIVPFRYN